MEEEEEEEEEETRKLKHRRPHHKSRTGCVQCKQRKVKCDEAKPTCRKCEHYRTPCSYLQSHPIKSIVNKTNARTSAHAYTSPYSQPSGSTPPSTLTAAAPSSPTDTFTMLDLELLHSWTNHTGQVTLNEQDPKVDNNASLLKVTFVELGFHFPFLIYEILSLAALHLAYMNPENAARYQIASTTHHDHALSLFQTALASLTHENCDACFAFNTLLTIHTCSSWGSQNVTAASTDFFSNSSQETSTTPPHIQWMKVQRGNRTVITLVWPHLREGPMAPLFRPWQNLSDTDPTPLPPAEEQQFSLIAEAWQNADSTLPECVVKVLDDSLRTLRRVTSISMMNQDISKHSSSLSWIHLVPEGYIQLVQDRNPQAMVILATYCVLLKRLENLWWCKGVGEKMFAVVRDVLDSDEHGCREGVRAGKWERWLRWPKEQILGMKTLGKDGKDGKEMEWETSTKCPGCLATGAVCTHL